MNGLPAIRIHFGMDGEWGRFFFNPDAPPIPGSLAWDDFREKFRVPFPLFKWILHAAKESGKFPYETPESG